MDATRTHDGDDSPRARGLGADVQSVHLLPRELPERRPGAAAVFRHHQRRAPTTKRRVDAIRVTGVNCYRLHSSPAGGIIRIIRA